MVGKMNSEISPDLFTLITIPEACKLWKKHDITVRRAIDEGRLEARKAPRYWLITFSSLKRLWGEPKGDLLETLFN